MPEKVQKAFYRQLGGIQPQKIIFIFAGHAECILELMESGANPNIRDIRGQTAVLLACKHAHKKVSKHLFVDDYSLRIIFEQFHHHQF